MIKLLRPPYNAERSLFFSLLFDGRSLKSKEWGHERNEPG